MAGRSGRAMLAGAAIAVTAVPLVISSAAAGAASTYSKPVAGFTIGDPGVIRDNGRYVVLSTGGLGQVATAPQAAGKWTKLSHALLTQQAAWASPADKSLWAPSEIKLATNTYVAFYAAVRKGSSHLRCIGTAVATTATGPFTPRKNPISCPGDAKAKDTVPGIPKTDSVIDATPRYLTVNGTRGLYLTYKTQRKKADGHYYSTVRMVRLDIAGNAAKIVGRSHQLTVQPNNIEENPVLVQRGAKNFTLFTSLGGYTLCSYHTQWRHSSNPWNWSKSPAHTLAFPGHTCATGDADVYPGLTKGSWRIFFSGRYPARKDSFKMYVGVLTWSGNTPHVTKLLAGIH